MSVRVDPILSTEILAGINQNQQSIGTELEQMGSGLSVNSIGQNPAAAAALVGNQTQSAATDQFLQNISGVQGQLQAGDSAMSQAVNLMTQAISLGVEGTNGTLSANDRQAVASEMTGILQQMLGIANLTFQGNYVFAGTADQTAPFTLDASSPDGVTYNGNTGVNSISIESGQSMAINVPGSQIFTNSAGDVFGALTQMITALQTNTNLPAANAALDNAFNQLNAQRVFYGNGLQQLNTATSYLNQEQVDLTTQENTLVGANIATVASNYSQSQVQQQALLTASGQVLGEPTLFDYLPQP